MPGPASDLSAPTQYTSKQYYLLASGDLDGDGILDIVAAGTGSWSLPSGSYQAGMDLFLGQADGGFSSLTHYDVTDMSGIATADLNGDCLSDVVFVSGSLNGDTIDVGVLLNQGNGILSPPVAYAANLAPPFVGFGGVGIGDVNGDGVPDLVVGGDSSFLLLGVGDGTFGPPLPLPVSWPYSGQSAGSFGGVAVADLNDDGRADVVINSASSYPSRDAMAVLLSLGDGGFEVTKYPSNGGGVAVLHRANAGAPDLAAGSYYSAWSVSIFRNRGDGHFDQTGVVQLPQSAGQFVVSGDWNGDCMPDLVAAGFGEVCGDRTSYPAAVVVLYGSADGGFSAPEPVKTVGTSPAGLVLVGPTTNPRGLAVADYCGDGGISVFAIPSKP